MIDSPSLSRSDRLALKAALDIVGRQRQNGRTRSTTSAACALSSDMLEALIIGLLLGVFAIYAMIQAGLTMAPWIGLAVILSLAFRLGLRR